MPVNILNLPGLNVLDFKDADDEYHIKASPLEISRCCPHCNKSNDIVSHAWRTLVIRDIPSHGKAVAIHLTVSGWLNNFPVLAAAYDLKERLYRIYDVQTPEEAWGEYLHWESTIPNELSKPFRAVKTAFRNWKPYILNYLMISA